MFSLMSEHLLEQNIISDNQWGFTSNKSITTALLALTHDWFKHLEAGNEVCVVFLDLQKAFDSVPHLLVVKNSGLYPILLKWICSYLTDRSQRVVVDGVASSEVHAVSSVPQGLGTFTLQNVYKRNNRLKANNWLQTCALC